MIVSGYWLIHPSIAPLHSGSQTSKAGLHLGQTVYYVSKKKSTAILIPLSLFDLLPTNINFNDALRLLQGDWLITSHRVSFIQ